MVPVLLALGVLSGCAGHAPAEPGASRPATSPPPALVAVPEQAQVPAPALRVGTSGDYPPFSEERDGRVVGFSAELMSAFAGSLGRPVEWVRFR